MLCVCCGRKLSNDPSVNNHGLWMQGPHGPVPYCADDPGGLCERDARAFAIGEE